MDEGGERAGECGGLRMGESGVRRLEVEEVRPLVSGVEGREPTAVEGRGMFSLATTIPR